MRAPLPSNEQARLRALKRYRVLDTEPESGYDDFTYLASVICGAPIALISLIDESRQWFKSKVGLEPRETPRDLAFCSHAIVDNEYLEVPDAAADPRFSDNALVTDAPNIRFYAGAPLVTPGGHGLGTLCVIDRKPRELDAQQREALRRLSRQVVAQLELRATSRELAETLERVKTLQRFIPVCAYCKNIRNDRGYWERLETFLHEHGDVQLSHGICPDCMKSRFPEASTGED